MSMLALMPALAVQVPTQGDPISPEAAAGMVPVYGIFYPAARDVSILTRHLVPEARMILAAEGADGSRTVRAFPGEDFAFGTVGMTWYQTTEERTG